MDSLFLWEEGVSRVIERGQACLFIGQTSTSYFLNDRSPSGKVIGWQAAKKVAPLRHVIQMSRRAAVDDQTSQTVSTLDI